MTPTKKTRTMPRAKKSPRYYKAGDQFIITPKWRLCVPAPEAYLLCQIASDKVLLVHMQSGNRWIDEPMEVNKVMRISKVKFQKHFGSRYHTPWSLT